tara:strand:+ start:303 stop:509 length:207 start_codon:yes stop_codon:yes gene_type:complete
MTFLLPKNAFFLGRVSKSEQNGGTILIKKNVFKKSPNFLRQSAYHVFSFFFQKKTLVVTAFKTTLTDE